MPGLTHGDFDRHIGSRNEFVAGAVERARQDGNQAVDAIAACRQATLGSVVDAHSSLPHCDAAAGAAFARIGQHPFRAVVVPRGTIMVAF
jgi:hypothetical protein